MLCIPLHLCFRTSGTSCGSFCSSLVSRTERKKKRKPQKYNAPGIRCQLLTEKPQHQNSEEQDTDTAFLDHLERTNQIKHLCLTRSGICPCSILSPMKYHKIRCFSLCMAFWIKDTFPRMVPLNYEWKSYKTSSKQSFPCCYLLHSVSRETELVNVYKIFGKLPPCGFCVNK